MAINTKYLLLESRIKTVKNKYKLKDNEIDLLVELDPTKNKKYLDRIAKWYLEEIDPKEIYRYINIFNFNLNNDSLKIKDINSQEYSSFASFKKRLLSDLTIVISPEEFVSEGIKKYPESKLLFQTKDFWFISLKSKESAIYYGKNQRKYIEDTKQLPTQNWCISIPELDRNKFEQYSDEVLVFVQGKTDLLDIFVLEMLNDYSSFTTWNVKNEKKSIIGEVASAFISYLSIHHIIDFITLCRLGELQLVKDLHKYFDIDFTDEFGNTALLYACINFNYELVSYLLSAGASTNIINKLGISPLSWATQNKDNTLYELLKDSLPPTIDKVNVNITDTNGYTMLMKAIIDKNDKLFSYLLDKGADVNVQTKEGYSALFLAVGIGNHSVVKELLKHGAYTENRTNLDDTPLMLASYNNDIASAKLLLEYGAEVSYEKDDGESAIYWAIENKNKDMEMLLRKWS